MEGFIEVFRYFNFLWAGIRWTVMASLISIGLGSLVGLIAALARLSKIKILERISIVFVDFFRTTPLLVQLIWFYYALPMLINFSLSAIVTGLLCLSLYAGSFISEIIRAGILSVSRGQTDAALALGMRNTKVMQRIILPQAIVRMLPPLASIFITLVKDSALLSIIGVPELMRQTNALGSFTLRRMEGITVAAIMYFGMAYPLSLGVNYLHKKFLAAN